MLEFGRQARSWIQSIHFLHVASRRSGATVMVVSWACGCAILATAWSIRSHEQELRTAFIERAAIVGLLAPTTQQRASQHSASAVAKSRRPRDAQVAEIYRIAAIEKLRVLGAEIESDQADPLRYTIGVRMRGAYPNAKRLIAQMLEGADPALVRNFSVRRLASGADLEISVLFDAAD